MYRHLSAHHDGRDCVLVVYRDSRPKTDTNATMTADTPTSRRLTTEHKTPQQILWRPSATSRSTVRQGPCPRAANSRACSKRAAGICCP